MITATCISIFSRKDELREIDVISLFLIIKY